MKIPRTLHFIWVGSPLPEWAHENIMAWHRVNPGWTIEIWREDRLRWLANWPLFDAAEFLVTADAVGQFRADLARYEILHQHGGFYADVDTYPLRPIDEALDGHEVFAAAEDERWIANTYLGAVPHHRVFKALIDALPGSIQSKRGERPCVVTGPQFLTPIWQSHKGYVAPRDEWFPYSWADVRKGRVPEIAGSPYAVHEWEHSRELRRLRGQGDVPRARA